MRLIHPDELLAVLRDVTVLDVRWRLGRTDGREAVPRRPRPRRGVRRPGDRARRPAGHPVGAAGGTRCPDPDRFAAAMRRGGRAPDRPVVVYDDWAGLAAARAWWLLRFHGHPDVRLLDGGWSAWLRPGRGRAGRGHAGAGDFAGGPGAPAGARRRRGGRGWPRRACCSTPGPPSGSAARPSRSTRWPATCPARSSLPDDGEPPRGPVPAAGRAGGLYGGRGGRGRGVLRVGGRPRPTTCSRCTCWAARGAYPGSWSGWVSDPGRPVRSGHENSTHRNASTAGGVGRLMFMSGGR